MATDVDIVNMALGYLGDSANVSSLSPPEPTYQAEMAARFYPLARDAALANHSWSFNTRRASLARLEAVPTFGWRYAFALPHDCLRLLSVHRADAQHDFLPMVAGTAPSTHHPLKPVSGTSVAFAVSEITETQQRVALCDEANVVARYRARVTDTGHYSPDFVLALAWLLAGQLAGPLLKGDEGAKMAQVAMQMYQVLVARAEAEDAAQHNPAPIYFPDPLRARWGYIGPMRGGG